MPIRTFKPTTPTLRWKAISDFSELMPKGKKPEGSLMESKHRLGGRNNTGRVTARRRGPGHKRYYRIVDFRRDRLDVPATVMSIEYDPNRSARIALVQYPDKEIRYILAPNGIKIGDKVQSGSGIEPQLGNCMPIREIPAGTFIHNIELFEGRGGQMARSAGAYAIVMTKEADSTMAQLKLPSGEVRLVHQNCVATIGQVGNIDHENESWGKAGRSRWLGWRPASRAVAKNPVDHPMGGGEGKSSGGRQACNRWGQLAKGLHTRKKSKRSNRYIIQRRPK
jgi:large subunit ribosomal protein L2